MGWISVDDRLPEIDKNCWRTDLPLYVLIDGFGVSMAYPAKWNDDPFCWIPANIMSHSGDKHPEVNDKNNLIGVTHWQPLPKPPKDKPL
ncbi:DUF551 domain-containing protein [Acinetobacter sp. 187]|uniref:DUF551 domain-containing protein n=1 Tax=Acinetobacter lanii TaxID=2715163 RepID=UPI001407EA4D|nr:DUF551 domain-containing protein [Acinetobacter lanii]NHC02372.1 DUF551 domain-containing protein [Acinetobacter lanii]